MPQSCEFGAETGLGGVDHRINFIVAGVQKAGTTALYDYLAEDPNIGLSKVKEVHFFDDERVDWVAPDYGAYHAQFDWTAPAIRGEATPIYLYWPRSLERIAAYNPAARLIVMLRDPVERAWSHWKMEYARGAETEAFSWCVRQGRRRLLDADPWGVHREFSYVERGFYGEQVERLLGLFPRGQLLILKADDLRRDPNTALASVNAFLGAPPPAQVTARDVHVGREMDYGGDLTDEDAAFLRRLYACDLARLEALTGVVFP
ncbi:sulfotransferase domain-containing protein [Phenylobacterium sp.]|uniref:sulfotransferase domain-containing protein n=1 Tax=Phenylobacterium sp. TaxID=1871053 RepID=UPI002735D228|nr:sulfotransferase domain-containing protein [Phenylobacterium sp.]MDP3856077.1 sulfotransferase [Phenylobacterium sp.]